MIARISLVAGLSLLLLVVAGCDDGYSKGGGQEQASGPVTGLLIVAQTSEGDTVDLAHETVLTWNVVDGAGTKLFGKDQISAKFMQKGVKYEKYRAKALEGSNMWLGKNHLEIYVQDIQVTGKEKAQTATLVVGPGVAAELRAIPNLDQLVNRAMIVFLLGKTGR